MRTLLLFLGLCCSMVLNAQRDYREGWVVDNLGDTLKGWVAYPSHEEGVRQCVFRRHASRDSPSKTYDAGLLKSYQVDDAFFVSVLLPDYEGNQTLTFAEVLVDSKVRLLRMGDFYATQQDGRVDLIDMREEVEQDELKGTEVRKRKGLLVFLNRITQECPAVSEYLKKLRPSVQERDLIPIIQIYNGCLGAEMPRSIVYRAGKPWSAFTFGFFAGATAFQTGFSGARADFNARQRFLSDVEFSNVQPLFGAFAYFTSPAFANRWGVVLEPTLQPYRLSAAAQTTLSEGIIERYEIDIKMINVDLPVLLRYRFSKGNMHPFIDAGLQMNWLIKVDNSFAVDREVKINGYRNVFQESGPFLFNLKNNQVGFTAGVGTIMGNESRIKPFVLIRATIGSGFFRNEVVNPEKNSAYFLVCKTGIVF